MVDRTVRLNSRGLIPLSKLPGGKGVAALTKPIAFAHQGGKNLAPGSTMEAYRAAVGYGADVLDADAQLLIGGALALAHDPTIDATTTRTGNLTDQSAQSLQQIDVDAGSWFGGGWANTLRIPLISQFLSEFGNRRVVSIESKTAGACATALAAEVQRFGVAEACIVSTSFWADVPTLVATGAHVQFVMVTGTERTAAALAAAGVKSVVVDYTAAAATTDWVDGMHAAGIEVYGYTINRQRDVATWMAKGTLPPDGWYSDDPIYSKGAYNGYRYRRTSDSFRSGTFNHGHLSGASLKRGAFDLTRNAWGFIETANNGWVGRLAGEMCPIGGGTVPTSYDLTFDIVMDASVDTNRYAAVFFGAADDRDLNGSGATLVGNNYYRALLSLAAASNVQLAKFTDNVVQSGAQLLTTTQIPYGTVVPCKIEVRPTTVAFLRTDLTSGNKVTLTDAAYRGGYFHLGCVGATAYFRNITVV